MGWKAVEPSQRVAWNPGPRDGMALGDVVADLLRRVEALEALHPQHEHDWLDDTRLASRDREYLCSGCGDTKHEPR